MELKIASLFFKGIDFAIYIAIGDACKKFVVFGVRKFNIQVIFFGDSPHQINVEPNYFPVYQIDRLKWGI